MQLVRFEPFDRFNKIQSLFDESFGRFRDSGAEGWHPPVDILESEDAYLLRAELPGMQKEDLDLELKDGTLTLTGERKATKLADGVQYRSVERRNGKFVRSFVLPETVQDDGIRANYKDGILEIHVPKAEEAKPRQIEISVH
jgi:HSP20 family protein